MTTSGSRLADGDRLGVTVRLGLRVAVLDTEELSDGDTVDVTVAEVLWEGDVLLVASMEGLADELTVIDRLTAGVAVADADSVVVREADRVGVFVGVNEADTDRLDVGE
jgi:hypothetical protein